MKKRSVRFRTVRDCIACGARRSVRWSIDAWVCDRVRCGAEFYPNDPPAEDDPYPDPTPHEDCAA